MRARASPTAMRLCQVVLERLLPHGWSVSCEVHGDYFNIRVDHALSTRSGFGFPNDDTDHGRFVEAELAGREYAVVAARPGEITHQSLIRGIRSAAQAHRWDSDVVTVIARLLYAEDLLTADEAKWLEHAGPAWANEEMPH